MDVIKYNSKESIIQEIKQLGEAIKNQREEMLVPLRYSIPNNDLIDVNLYDVKYVVNDESKIIFSGEGNKIIPFNTINTFVLIDILKKIGVPSTEKIHEIWNLQGVPTILEMMKFTTKEGKTDFGGDMYITRKGNEFSYYDGTKEVVMNNIPFFILIVLFRCSLQDDDDYNNIEELSYFR